MNLLTVIVIIIIALCVLRGYRKGLAGGLASLVSLAVSLVLVSFLSPQVTAFLEEHTPVYGYVLEKCEQSFDVSGAARNGEGSTEKEKTQQAAEGTVNIPESEGASEAASLADRRGQGSASEAESLLEGMNLPEMIKNMLLQNNTPEKYAELAAATFSDYVPKFMANLVMNVLSFVVTWILVLLILRIIMALLGMVNHIPVIGGINRLLGAGLGFAEAILIVWILFLLITAFGSTPVCRQLLDMIGESAFLKELYNANLLMELVQNTVGKFAV